MIKNQLYINSDCSIIIEFKGEISITLTEYILGVKQHLESLSLEGFIEAVPAYNSLLLIFRADTFDPEAQLPLLEAEIGKASPVLATDGKQHIIPVCYDNSLAPDIKHVAEHCGMTTTELISKHTNRSYPVFMLGFLPGFLYLGELPEELHCPRREEPRPLIEAGAVGIGGSQTGIYPINSPGGWQIIGKTPLKMLDTNKAIPAIAKPLDTVIFKSISLEEFNHYES